MDTVIHALWMGEHSVRSICRTRGRRPSTPTSTARTPSRRRDPGSPFVISATKAEGQSTSLAERVSKRLGADGALATQQAAAAIRLWLDRFPVLWEDGHVKVEDLWRQYTTFPYMPRLRDRTVLVRGIAAQPLLWEQEGFALALSYVGEHYEGLEPPSDGELSQVTDSMLLVKPEVALSQRQRETKPDPHPRPWSRPWARSRFEPRPWSGSQPKVDYFFGSKTLDATHYALTSRS